MAKVITIGRQLHAGGRTIGKYVAEKLGIPYYDSEIITLAAERKGLDSKICAENEEKSSIFSGFYPTGNGVFYPVYHDAIKDTVFLAQTEIIRELAKNDCVIVGRCSEQILKGYADLLRVFLYADTEDRVARLKQDYPDIKKPEKFLKKADKQRARYYSCYTGEIWGDKANYDIMLNTTGINTEILSNAIVELYRIGKTK